MSSKYQNDVSYTNCRTNDRNDDPIAKRNHNTNHADGLLRCGKDASNKVEAAEEIVVEVLAHDSSGKESPPVISATIDQFASCAKKPKQNHDRKLCSALGEISSYSTRDPVFNSPQSSVPDYTCSRQDCVSNVVQRSISPNSAALSTHTEKHRISVWDRLGRPSDSVPAEGKSIHLQAVDHKKQDKEMLNQHMALASELNSEASRLDKRSAAHINHVESEKLQNCATGTFDLNPANNIKRQRLFEEASGSPSADSVSSKDTRKSRSPVQEIAEEFKESKLATKDSETSPDLAVTMLDMKQRLQKMETEMYMLRSRKVKMENDGKLGQMTNPGELKYPEEDVDSRTVFVTNVHFAATKEALSSFFAKCGIIVNVVKLVDIITAKPSGSAYVTFVSKDSVERALALSGTALLSRIVKVSRKAEANASALAPTLLAGKPYRAAPLSGYMNSAINKSFYYSPSPLQWRRVNAKVPSHL